MFFGVGSSINGDSTDKKWLICWVFCWVFMVGLGADLLGD